MRGKNSSAARTVGPVAVATMLALAGCGGDADDDTGDTSDGADGDRSQATPTGSAPAGVDDDSSADGENGDGPATAPAAFNDDGAEGTYACGGQHVTINGENVTVHLTGECGAVVVNGAGSEITVDDAERIVVNVDAHVTYSGDPEVTLNHDDAAAEEA